MNSTEIIGYVASAILVVSFFFSNIRKLRWWNSVGCALFVVYALVQSPALIPVAITNAFILGANLYHLNKSKKKR